jgi:hypothetical protein
MLKYLSIFIYVFLAINLNAQTDWLIDGSAYKANIKESDKELVLSNDLISRTFRIAPNAAIVRLDNLMTGESLLRGVKPEALVKINGIAYEVGGLKGQPNLCLFKAGMVR